MNLLWFIRFLGGILENLNDSCPGGLIESVLIGRLAIGSWSYVTLRLIVGILARSELQVRDLFPNKINLYVRLVFGNKYLPAAHD